MNKRIQKSRPSVLSRIGPLKRATSGNKGFYLRTNFKRGFRGNRINSFNTGQIRGIRSRSSQDSPMKIRMRNGAIVSGLRSDRLLLEQARRKQETQWQWKPQQLQTFSHSRRPTTNAYRPVTEPRVLYNVKRNSSSNVKSRLSENFDIGKVSLSHNRGLTVNVDNSYAEYEVAAPTTTDTYYKHVPASTTKALIHKPEYSSNEDSDEMQVDGERWPPRRKKKDQLWASRNIVEAHSPPPPLRLVPERPPPPKPHRQVLDPQVQKEIALLQGTEVSFNKGPGQGIKGFKLVPAKTVVSTHERFSHKDDT